MVRGRKKRSASLFRYRSSPRHSRRAILGQSIPMRPRILQSPRHLGHSSPRSSPSSALRPFTTTPTLSTRIPALLVNPKPLNPTPKYVRPRRLPRATALGYSELQVRCTAIPPVSKRPSLINEESARDLVRAWGIDKLNAKEGQGGVTVIDCYAGEWGGAQVESLQGGSAS